MYEAEINFSQSHLDKTQFDQGVIWAYLRRYFIQEEATIWSCFKDSHRTLKRLSNIFKIELIVADHYFSKFPYEYKAKCKSSKEKIERNRAFKIAF